MATTVSKTIGTGGDYSTVQAWEDAAPANLVTADQIWQGKLKNEEFVPGGTVVTIAGSTSDSTRYKELTTDTGASFLDNANVRTNALRYNASNGAGMRNSSNSYAAAVRVEEANVRLSKLQVSSVREAVLVVAGATNVWADKCILHSSNTANAGANWGASGGKLTNSLAYRTGNGSASLLSATSTFTCVNVTLAAASDVAAATNAITQSYPNSAVYKNVAAFGCSGVLSSTTSTTSTTCRTNVASPPTGWTQVAYDTSTGSGFEATTAASADFRLKSTSALIDVGTTDSTNAAVDISGTSRPQGSAYDVGAWEAAASATYVSPRILTSREAVRRASRW